MELRVTVVQANLVWENPPANRKRLARMMEMAGSTDLILLPETFSTGFTMNTPQFAETMEGPTVNWLRQKAEELQSAVAGSLIINDNGEYVNRLVWASPECELQWYDKKHLFTMGGEPLHFSSGNRRVTLEWRGWRIRPLICYDLRFPVWSRNHDDYDLLIYLANWPSARHQVWKTLPLARAIENQCYCIGVNRTGTDGGGLTYLGDSMMVTPKGETTCAGEGETVRTFTLSLQELKAFRKKFPLLGDRDTFSLTD